MNNSHNSVFKVIIVHEDSVTGLQSIALLKRLVARLEIQFDAGIDPWQSCNHIWKFEWLQDPELLEQAVTESIEADIIIISAEGHTELPVCVRSWIESVLPQKQGIPTVLVALLGGRQIIARTASLPPARYLRQLAERYGVDFFCDLDDRSQRIESGIESSLSRLEDDSEFLEKTIHCDFNQRE